MLAEPLGKKKEGSWLIRWGCPGVRQRPHGTIRLSFPGISGPGQTDDASLASSSCLKARPCRCRTPGGGTKLKKTWPSFVLCVDCGFPPPNAPGESQGPRVLPLFPGSASVRAMTFGFLFCFSCSSCLCLGVGSFLSGLLTHSGPVQEASTAFLPLQVVKLKAQSSDGPWPGSCCNFPARPP